MKATELLGKSLSGFVIQELTEVFKVDEDGRKKKSIGFFHDENIAKAFAGNQTDANWHRTNKILILTNGKAGFVIGEEVVLLDDEKALLEIKEKAIAKLSEAERKTLGL